MTIIYTGNPKPDWHVTVHNGDHTSLLHHTVRHSPTGFAWGYGGSGPAELARCLLLDATGSEEGYQQFKFDVVCRWPMDEGWTMSQSDIQAWQRAYREVMSR